MTKRKVLKIKSWMAGKGLKERDIVLATGEDQSYVNKTINGSRNNRATLEFLLNNGCPKSHLALPKDMKEMKND